MIKITINGKKYTGVYSWDDITLSRFCDLASIPIPEGYENFILADGKFSIDNEQSVDEYVKVVTEITEQQLKVEFPTYYRKVITCLSDVPNDLVIPDDKANDLYEWYFKPFVVSLLYHTPLIHFYGQLKQYEPSVVRSFDVAGDTFYLPETVNLLGQDMPLANESVITYTEASDIFRGMKLGKEDIHKLALFMAIYCRKKGEAYDERIVVERKELFMSASMSVVWSVFFCIIKRLPCSISYSQLFGSLPKSIREVAHQAQIYRGMVAGDSSLKLQAMEALEPLK